MWIWQWCDTRFTDRPHTDSRVMGVVGLLIHRPLLAQCETVLGPQWSEDSLSEICVIASLHLKSSLNDHSMHRTASKCQPASMMPTQVRAGQQVVRSERKISAPQQLRDGCQPLHCRERTWPFPVLSNSRLWRPTQSLVARENLWRVPIILSQHRRGRRLRGARAGSQGNRMGPEQGPQWDGKELGSLCEVVGEARCGVRTTKAWRSS